MIDNENTDIKRETDTNEEFATFIKETRQKASLHEYLAIAAKAYIDGIQTALKCQQTAQILIK